MKTVSKDCYEYGELGGDARERAFETWSDYVHRHADNLNAPVLDEDLDSLKAVLASISCKLARWSVSYDGSDGSVQVELGDLLEDELSLGDVEADGLPRASGDGLFLGERLAERWNSEHRPALAREVALRGRGAADAYLERAQELADDGLADILADLSFHLSRELFDQDAEEGLLYFEEDGTYVPGA